MRGLRREEDCEICKYNPGNFLPLLANSASALYSKDTDEKIWGRENRRVGQSEENAVFVLMNIYT